MIAKRRLVLSLALSAALLVVATIAHASDPSPAEVDAIFADYDNTTSPGCSLGVVRDGELIYKRGYGMANLEYGIALSPGSVFRTASVGKQFTAMAVAILAEQDAITLDDPLSQLFPEFSGWADEVTLRQLVHHTSGIRDYLTLAWLAGMGDESYYTDEYALDLLARQKSLNFTPGEEHLYSNSGYLLLAHAVKRATGKSLREWAAENMFGPLGMDHSHYHDDHTHIVPARADGYAPTEDGFRISMTILDMVGDGGVYTTVEDFLLWDRNFYDNKLGKGGPQLIEQVTTPGLLNHQGPMTYAFGLDVDDYRGLPTVAHSGGFVGFRTDTIRFPEQKFSVVVYCNRADADPTARSRQVADLYLADLMEPDKIGASTSPKNGGEVEYSTARLQALTGHYWNEKRRAAWDVEWQEEKLVLIISDEDRFEMIPMADGRFAIQGPWLTAEVNFEALGEDGQRMSILIEDADEPRNFEKYVPRAPSSQALEAYAGIFYSEELGVSYALDVQDGSLGFRIVRHERHPLEPLFDEIFSSDEYGTFEFQRGADGVVEGFALDAGRVRNLQFDRQ